MPHCGTLSQLTLGCEWHYEKIQEEAALPPVCPEPVMSQPREPESCPGAGGRALGRSAPFGCQAWPGPPADARGQAARGPFWPLCILTCVISLLPSCGSLVVRTLSVVSALATGTPALQPRGTPQLQMKAVLELWWEASGGAASFSWEMGDMVVTAFPHIVPPPKCCSPVLPPNPFSWSVSP